MWRFRVLVAALAVVLLPSCFGDESYYWGDREVITPQGYWVTYEDRGSVESGLFTEDWVHLVHGEEVRRSARYLSDRYLGPGYDSWMSMAKQVRWVIYDDVSFQRTPSCQRCGVDPGFAFGEMIGSDPIVIRLAFWSRDRWGVRNLDNPLPAMAHELGHVWYGAEFGHGWEPPLR